jgi:hypothetical protein
MNVSTLFARNKQYVMHAPKHGHINLLCCAFIVAAVAAIGQVLTPGELFEGLLVEAGLVAGQVQPWWVALTVLSL